MIKNLSKSISLVIPCNNEQDAIKTSLKIYMDILKDLLNNKTISSFDILPRSTIFCAKDSLTRKF